MRVALLSSVEEFSGGEGKPRAFARVGGRRILQRQVDFAISMGCEQIACLSDGLHPELVELQQAVENAGAQFQVIRDARPLSGLVKAADELLVIADGLAFDEELASQHLDGGKTVLTLSAEKAVPESFERLDREFAWAGIMLANGSLVEKLADMPADVDPQSSLLRLALQSGTKTGEIAESALSDHHWAILRDDEALQAFENNWLGNMFSPAAPIAPVSAGADYAGLTVLRRHSHPVKAAQAVGGLGYALTGVAVLCGYLGYSAAGFALAAIAAFAFRFGGAISRILKGRIARTGVRRILSILPAVLLDAALIALAWYSVVESVQVSALFAVTILVGLLRLAAEQHGPNGSTKLQDLFEDRGVLAVVLGIGLVAGQLVPVIQLLAVLVLIFLLFQTYSLRITRA